MLRRAAAHLPPLSCFYKQATHIYSVFLPSEPKYSNLYSFREENGEQGDTVTADGDRPVAWVKQNVLLGTDSQGLEFNLSKKTADISLHLQAPV